MTRIGRSMKQAHVIVSGYVQGVWYRKFVKTNAQKLGLTGWVRNIPENRVEGLIQGPQNAIKKLIELCGEGPQFAEVKDIRVEWEEGELEFEDFKIA